MLPSDRLERRAELLEFARRSCWGNVVRGRFKYLRVSVREGRVRVAALERVRTAFEDAGLVVRGSCESPITGHKGNVEYLLCGDLPA